MLALLFLFLFFFLCSGAFSHLKNTLFSLRISFFFCCMGNILQLVFPNHSSFCVLYIFAYTLESRRKYTSVVYGFRSPKPVLDYRIFVND